MFDDRKATGNPGRITCCGAQGESQQQFPDEAPTFHTLSIFKHCQNPEAAFEFIAYCTGAEGAQRLHLEYGENSARRSVMTSPEAITKDPSVLRRVLALEQGRPASAPVPQWLDLLVALWEAVQFCLLGYLPAQAALSRAAEKWTKLLKQSPPQWEYWE